MQIGHIGTGLMGYGIALTLAGARHSIVVTDPIEGTRAILLGRVAEILGIMGVDGTDVLPRISVVGGTADAVRDAAFML